MNTTTKQSGTPPDTTTAKRTAEAAAVRSSDLLGEIWCKECESRTIGRHGMGCSKAGLRDKELRDSVYGPNTCKTCYGRRIIDKLHRRDDGVIERLHYLCPECMIPVRHFA